MNVERRVFLREILHSNKK